MDRICLGQINSYWIRKNIKKEDNKVFFLFKAATDISVGCAGFVLFLITYLPLLFLIKAESKGPVLYKQERVGKDGKKFMLYKYRTMYQDGTEYKELWREKNGNSVTRVGKILRRLHTDELPQAINLLRGDISFVGPRPEWSELARTFEAQIPYYNNRYLVKPGIIGWAQINYPPSKSVQEAKEKFEYDLYYIKNRSMLLDLEIMLKAFKLFAW